MSQSRPSGPYVCESCGKGFTRKDNLYAHMKRVHKKMPDYSRSGKLRCPISGCNGKNIMNYTELRTHLTLSHSLQLEEEELTFPSEDGKSGRIVINYFLQWKNELERKETSSYVNSVGWKKLANEDRTAFLYCHRSGFFSSRSKGHRRLKSQGTNKIGANCPSSIHVTVKQDLTAHVMFYKTHCGHSCSSAHVNLQREDRTRIADQLKSGVTMQRVLDDIRHSVLEYRTEFLKTEDQSRLSLMDHQDLKNIKRDFNLNLKECHRDSDLISGNLPSDSDSIAATTEDSPVLYTKMQGCEDPNGVLGSRDFMLVIMTKFQKEMLLKFGHNGKICVEAVDSTYGANGYDFELNTLFTIDEFGSGCPVAFCISNRTDTTVLQTFFLQVLDKVGKIQANVLMTEDTQAYVDAWTSVMGPPQHHLLCSWHVDKNWRSQLPKVRGCKEKKALVYKAVRTLLQEPNIELMQLLQTRLLEELYIDEETREFGEYFANYYAYRPDKWAYCYRIGLGIHTNMYFESTHKALKHIYLEEKKNKCLDTCVNSLIKMSRDKFFERLIKITKKTPTSRIRLINQAHTRSLSIDLESIISSEEGVWEVISTKNTDIKFKVTKTETTECENCMSRCKECDICVHMFSCECIDSVNKYNICKHIHATVRKLKELICTPDKFDSTMTDEYEENEVTILLEAVKSHDDITEPTTKDSSKIIQKLELCLGLMLEKQISDEANNNIHRWLDKVIKEIQT